MSKINETAFGSMEQAMSNPIWDAPFWDTLPEGEAAAKDALLDLYEGSYGGDQCSCENCCVLRTVLEAVRPVLTQQVERIVAVNQPAQVFGGCANGSCRCSKE